MGCLVLNDACLGLSQCDVFQMSHCEPQIIAETAFLKFVRSWNASSRLITGVYIRVISRVNDKTGKDGDHERERERAHYPLAVLY